MNCPVCGSAESRVLRNDERQILRSCLSCGSNFAERRKKPAKKYNEDYFKGNHKKAYGKTYSEDEQNIRAFSKRRLGVIRKLVSKNGTVTGPRLLDIGSALGTFCDEANHNGFDTAGVEISAFARRYAKEKYRLNTFSSLGQVKGKYDCVTLWFTLEHMDDPESWIKRARSLLSRGGLIALSVPNGAGAFARFNPKKYYTARPEEHVFEPSLKGMRRMLERLGFEVKASRIFGLHPERLGLPEWPVLKTLQKILKLGDTFEIYALRK